MYLIKVLDNIIEDLENGRTYVLNESIPDYDTNTAATTVYVRSWHVANNETVDLAHELDAIKLWDHLTSLCKLNTVDATKAQAAPQEKPTRFDVGDKVKLKIDGSRAEVIATEWNGRRDRVLLVYEDGANEPRYQQELEPAD